jgi:hypothetical protein
MNEPAEKLVMAKELVDLFKKQGVEIGYRYARAVIAACPRAVRGRYVKFSDAWTWWVLNPGFQPFSEKGEKLTNTGTLSHAQATADN